MKRGCPQSSAPLLLYRTRVNDTTLALDLAEAVVTGKLDHRWEAVLDTVRASVRDQLLVNNPKHLGSISTRYRRSRGALAHLGLADSRIAALIAMSSVVVAPMDNSAPAKPAAR